MECVIRSLSALPRIFTFGVLRTDRRRLVAAAQEERFTRIKHDSSLPRHAFRWCLARAGVTIADVDCIGWYEDPVAKLDRQLWMGLPQVPPVSPAFLFRLDAARARRELDELLGGTAASSSFLTISPTPPPPSTSRDGATRRSSPLMRSASGRRRRTDAAMAPVSSSSKRSGSPIRWDCSTAPSRRTSDSTSTTPSTKSWASHRTGARNTSIRCAARGAASRRTVPARPPVLRFSGRRAHVLRGTLHVVRAPAARTGVGAR